MLRFRIAAVAPVSMALMLVLSACGGSGISDARTASGKKVSEATSLSDFGSLDQLVQAAKAEGQLNVIGVPRDWSNYGAIIDSFSETYGIKVNELQPDASSADEIAAAKNNKGLDIAPDVFDIGDTVAQQSTTYFAEYRNQHWGNIDDKLKDPSGLYVASEGGYMSIGFDSAKVPTPSSFAELLKPAYKGTAISGDPTKTSVGLAGVGLATLQEGGTLDDYGPGIDFFARLRNAGNLVSVKPSAATVTSGETRVVISYDYSNVAYGRDVPGWRVVIPAGAAYGGYLYQAINKNAPHPAAARLWQEFIYQPQVQNLWIKAGARSPLEASMQRSGEIDQQALAALPPAPARVVIPTVEQATKAGELVNKKWAAAVG
ncbi:ABC transporter substrate-binding protein [Mycolicibacterium nivoides]|uniref:ABC transporter substrate-binding protein n=1 Tax=Mycolicibacterium nivoides TaxID=2487344 RepID=UPI003C2D63CF